MKLCPIEPSGVQAMMTAMKMSGFWQRLKGEKDTEKVKRIYKAMTAECETVEVVDFMDLCVRLVRDRNNATASFNDLGEYMKQNGYKIVKVSDEKLP